MNSNIFLDIDSDKNGLIKKDSNNNKKNKKIELDNEIEYNLLNNIKKKSEENNKYHNSIKCLIILFLIYIIIFDFQTIQVDLNNYLDKVYGEDDLLTIIKEKEKKLFFSFGKKRIEIEKEIEYIYNLIEKIKKKKKEIIDNNPKIKRDDGKLILDCSYALNNGFVYPTLVSLESLVINAGDNTFYNIHILLSPDFTEENKKILKSVEINYKDHCQINFINMGDKYKGKDTNSRIPTASYYRLDLHNLLPNVDRILYMDGDTAIFQDLSELITLDMKGNYILGFLDTAAPNLLEKYNVKNAIILCAGVILMDLNEMRKNNMTEKFNDFLDKNLGNIYQHDQTTINVVCQEKLSTLPPKYGLWNYNSFYDLYRSNIMCQLPWIRFNKKELLFAHNKPAIIHYAHAKPFHKHLNRYYYKEWWEYAKRTDYYDEICNYANSIK